MEREFSKKKMDAESEKRKIEFEKYLKSPKHKERLKRWKNNPSSKIVTIGESMIPYLKALKDWKPIVYDEVEKVKEIMRTTLKAAEKEGWIIPYDEDELQGFYMYKYYTSETGEVKIDRGILKEFSDFRKSEMQGKDFRVEFKETYNKEVTPERIKTLKDNVAKYKTSKEKLHFLHNEFANYMQGVSAEILDVSGRTSYPNFPPGTHLFFDSIIKSEIDLIKQLDNLTDVNTTGEDGSNKPTVKSYAILHAIWRRHDNTKAITDTNKVIWANKYSISQNTLKQQFDKYYERNERIPTSDDKRAVLPFIKSFSIAVELIKTLCPKAYAEAKDELSALTKHYQNKAAQKKSNPL